MNSIDERCGILAAGNWIIDHVKIIDNFPAQDTLVNILSQSQGTGGAPYNALVDLAKLGADFPLEGIGLVGDDENGRTILKDCEKFGIDAKQIHWTKEAPTSYTDVMTVQSTGRRTFFHARGANALLNEKHFDLKASNARIFNLGYLLLLDALDVVAEDGTTGAARLLKQAGELGFMRAVDVVSEDSDRFVAVVTPVLPHIDYFIINEFEASKITGIEVNIDGKVDFKALSRAAERIFALGVKEWVIIHCPAGALARNSDGEEILMGSIDVPVADIVGTAGAGDAFAAGALLGLHDELDIEECLRIASCSAASCLSDSTCTGGIKPLEECYKLEEKYGYQEIRG
ncbi:MAG: carbohydrate kinase family protein [Kiritimatiellae bacterium]|nr:carbohydrate kinase family protein [Kiritimatiellia bacterium]